jgi:hypothetical protein
MCRHRPQLYTLFDNFYNQFDFRCKRVGDNHPDCAPRVTACVAEDFEQQITAPVYHCWGVVEAWCDVDHPEYLDNPYNVVEPDERMYRLQGVERAQSRSLIPLVNRQICADVAFDFVLLEARYRARTVHQIADLDGPHESARIELGLLKNNAHGG